MNRNQQELIDDGTMPIYYTLQDLARYSRLKVETVREHRRLGMFQAIRLTPKGPWRVSREEALRYVGGR